MEHKLNMAKVLKDYHKAQKAMNKMGLDYYFHHADEDGTEAHDVQQIIAKTSAIILWDMNHRHYHHNHRAKRA